MVLTGAKILLLEDDPNLGALLKEHLCMRDFAVTLCVNGVDGMTAFNSDKFDLCLVDIMMPRMDGFTFTREIRKNDESTPIIFLTAKSLQEDKIEGFKIGCDDYITKPFSMEELLLRIHAVLKRSKGGEHITISQSSFEIGDYSFDYGKQILENSKCRIRLTPKESELLRLLCIHKGRTLEREKALREIWGNTSYFSGRSMDVFISKLRKHFKDDGKIEIMAIHGKGFRLIAD
ncbi:MAG: response regulator transcription factor [Candidatus Zixiibacteriota bacterium]|nr:MAG: response regulator transcription factor [candidate division Zixibacteria bacterium]